MRSLMMTAAIAALAFGIPSGSHAAPPQDACATSDTGCQLREIDRRLARIERMLDRLDRGGRDDDRPGDRDDAAARGVSIAVNTQCSFTNCATVAAQACQTAGFTRGAPDEIDTTGPWQRVVRATCF